MSRFLNKIRSTLDARRSTLDARRSTLDARRSTLDARRSHSLATLASIALLLGLAACAANGPGAAQGVLNCPGDHTPVVDLAQHQALGCTPAKGNKIVEKSDCSAFPAGARTTDVTGATFECSVTKGKLVWLPAKYAEPTQIPNATCAHVGDVARAPDGSLLQCVWNNADFHAPRGPEVPNE